MLKLWERVRHQVASRWVEGAVLVAVAVQAFGTGPAQRKPADHARVTTVVATRVVMAAPDLDLLRPLGGALDPSPLESFDFRTRDRRAHEPRTRELRARSGAAAIRALRDAERAGHAPRAALSARRAVERKECDRTRHAAPRAATPHATPRPAPAAAPNLRRHTTV